MKNLPDEESPLLFGLNENANITYEINEANNIVNDILSISKNAG